MLVSDPLVLCYHGVSDRWPSELAVRPEQLRRQISAVLDAGYRAVDFSTAVSAPRGAKLTAVTFDDGYRSIIEHAAPVLDALGVPGTVFVPAAFIGSRRLSWAGIDGWLSGPFEAELEPMDWASLRALSDAGWEIGSHTCTHPDLTRTPDARLEDELLTSRATIERRLGRPCRSLAYPFGAWDQRVVTAARAAGYAFAATLPARLDEPHPLAWPRIGVYLTDGSYRFRLKVSRAGRAVRRTSGTKLLLAANKLALKVTQPDTALKNGPTVLVTDGDQRSMLAVTRALGSRGYRVSAAASSHLASAHWSRFCAGRPVLADPLLDAPGYVDGLVELVRSRRSEIFIPGSDQALLIASRNRARLEPFARIGLPPHATVLRTLDKLALGEAAVASGLATPDGSVCTTVAEASRAARSIGYPVVVKPRSSVFEVDGRLRQLPGWLLHSDEELDRIVPAYGNCFLIQRKEVGAVVSYGGVFAGGCLLGSAVSRYVRTTRPGAGNVAFSETIAAPERLRTGVTRLLERIGHEGIFELEVIARPDGAFVAIDLNPRPYGSLALATRAGANLPDIWCQTLVGDRPAAAEAVPGYRYRWGEADAFHLLCSLRDRRLSDGARVLIPHRRVAHAHFLLSDPGPAAARALWLARELSARALEG